MTSAISRMPRLMPCSWSPVRAMVRNRNESTISATVISDWPTPTVSTRTTSYPAASTTTMDSRVACATPPSVPEVGDGRMNACGSTESRCMRVLSPRIEPPERAEEGSTARTATFDPAPVRVTPSWSMNVDLPTPGTPLIPTRRAPPACGSSSTSSSCAASRWSARRDSTSVIARDPARRSPASTPSARAATSVPKAGRERAQQLLRRLGDDRSRLVDRRGAHLLEGRDVVRRDHAADDDQDVVRAELGERVAQRRLQREVTGRQRVDPDDVDVGLDRLPGDLLRRLEQRAHVDVEAEVGERGGDHLLAAVVAVLTHLGDEDPRPPALGLL